MKRIHSLLAIGCGLLFAASPCFAQMYTAIDLITPDTERCFTLMYAARGINSSGDVVGSCMFGHYPDWAFRAAANSPITDDLGTLGGPYSQAFGMNDLGQVVGFSFSDAAGHYSAFRTTPNNRIDPATDDLGIDGSSAYGINNAGQVVGQGPKGHAFRTAPNSPIDPATDDLGTLGGTYSWGLAINASGQVAGYSGITGDVSYHAFRTAPNTPINPATDDLGTLGGEYTRATSINVLGQVVGFGTLAGERTFHAFRAAPHRRINAATDDLGTLGGTVSLGNGIDAFGQVVGSASLSGDSTFHAFLYSGGVMHDLNNLIPSGFGCELVGGNGLATDGINDAGQIVTTGSCGGGMHPVVLTPIYQGLVRPPIKADGSSVFSAKRESVPVAFLLNKYGTRTCTLPAATIAIVRVTDGRLTTARNAKLSIAGCRYAYDLKPNRLGVGVYRADISIDGIMVGHAVFAVE